MATNDFLPFAGGAGANVLSQADYAALTSLIANGFSSGVAQSAQLNKVWRQASIMAAVLAQLIVDNTGQNATDDGSTATLLSNLKKAVAGRLLNVQAFNGSTIYTPTGGTRYLRGRMWGAGGGGSGGTSSSPGVGGGGGGYIEFWIPLPTGSLAVSIGAGGAGGAISGGNGGTGGNTSFAGLTAGGGGGGNAGNPGAGGTATGGYINVPGGTGQGVFTGLPAGIGGGSFGASGGLPRTASGSAGMSYGGGGSGGASSAISGGTTSAGGGGANGFLLLEEYA